CIAGSIVTGPMTSNVWSCQPVALPSARRTAMPTASGVKPMKAVCESTAPSMADVSCSTDASTDRPVRAALTSRRASSGSRKKSPETLTWARRSFSTSRSTATSLPPRTLYSPRMSGSTPTGVRCFRRASTRTGGAGSASRREVVATGVADGRVAAAAVHDETQDDAERTCGHADVADHGQIDAGDGVGHRERENRADRDESDGSTEVHVRSLPSMTVGADATTVSVGNDSATESGRPHYVR